MTGTLLARFSIGMLRLEGATLPLPLENQQPLPNPPISGTIKSNSFGWEWGGRFGVGVIIPHDHWDFYLNFTYYRNHDSDGTQKSPPSFLVSQVGLFRWSF